MGHVNTARRIAAPTTHRRAAYAPAPSLLDIQAGRATARQGMSGEAVRWLQTQLNAKLPAGQRLTVDGKWGARTQAALDALGQPGRTLDRAAVEQLTRAPSNDKPRQITDGMERPGGSNGTARFTGTEGAGRTNQLKTGKITVNGSTYDFVSGGHGRGNLPPGEYKVEPWSPSGRTMYKDGVGFSYRLLKKQNGKWVDSGIHDPRLGVRNRSYFRIHPDGGSRGTEGCIGIRGDGATQRRFKRDLDAELTRARREGRPFTITVG